MTDAPDPAPASSPLFRAWQGTSRANRVLAGAGVAVLLGVGGGLLLTGGDDDEPVSQTGASAVSAPPSAAASVAPSTSPSPSAPIAVEPSSAPSSAPSAPSAAPAPAPPTTAPAPSSSSPAPAATRVLELNGDDLGVTQVGAPDTDAVRAVTAVLGPPLADPAPATACVGAGDREVEWDGFRLSVTDGRIDGWTSTGRLETPSGVGVGTTVTELQEVYGDRLELYDANPDSGPGFVVDGVALGGDLTGPGADARVVAFWNGACSPP